MFCEVTLTLTFSQENLHLFILEWMSLPNLKTFPDGVTEIPKPDRPTETGRATLELWCAVTEHSAATLLQSPNCADKIKSRKHIMYHWFIFSLTLIFIDKWDFSASFQNKLICFEILFDKSVPRSLYDKHQDKRKDYWFHWSKVHLLWIVQHLIYATHGCVRKLEM